MRLVKVAEFLKFCLLLSVNFTSGPGDNDKDAASVRADHPVPFDVSLYYYEVQVVNKGRDGFVGTTSLKVYIAIALLSFAGPAEQAAWIGLLTSWDTKFPAALHSIALAQYIQASPSAYVCSSIN